MVANEFSVVCLLATSDWRIRVGHDAGTRISARIIT